MGVSDEALGVIPGRTAPSADLGGSKLSHLLCCTTFLNLRLILTCIFIGSKYSNENFED